MFELVGEEKFWPVSYHLSIDHSVNFGLFYVKFSQIKANVGSGENTVEATDGHARRPMKYGWK